MKAPFFLIGMLASFTVQAVEDIRMEGPNGGWRHYSDTAEHDSEWAAAYPKPPVDRGRQKNRTLIEGRIQQAGQNRPPGRFVVNGIDMPLYTDEAGWFVKPWAFGPGSNNVEIISPTGSRKRIQFFEADPNRVSSKLRIVLGWDDAYAEVDLHILTPDGEHASWMRPLLRSGGGLDVDSVDGGGPEIFSTATPQTGTYLIYVNYWGNFNATGYNFVSGTNEKSLITTRITIVSHENTVDERQETWVVPLRRMGDLTLVRALHYKEQQ